MNNAAKDAIARSVSHNEIVTIDYTDSDALQTLLVEGDDWIEANGVAEYWGTTESGSEWRVHVRLGLDRKSEPHSLTGDQLQAAKADYDVHS